MAGAAEPHPCGNFDDAKIETIQKQVLRSRQALSQDVCMGRLPDSLFEGALEMAHTYTSNGGKMMK